MSPLRKGYCAQLTHDERGPVVVVWLTAAVACPVCGTAHVALRNRGGRTRCVQCDVNTLTQTEDPAHV